jgi:hypothetical protein
MTTRARHYCFTINNFTNDDLIRLRALHPEGKVKYLVFSQEVGESGTAHLQGYVALVKQTVFSTVKTLIGDRAHLEVCKGNPQQNKDYCTKGGVGIEEFGELPVQKKGTRSDLIEFQNSVKAGLFDKKRLREEHPEVCAKYHRYVMDYISDHAPRPAVTAFALYEWQQDLYDHLKRPPDDREIELNRR